MTELYEKLLDWYYRHGLSAAKRRQIYYQIALLLGYRQRLVSIIEELLRRERKRNKRSPAVAFLNHILFKMRSGSASLGVALEGWVPAGEASLISAAEGSEQLGEILMRASELSERIREIRSVVIGAVVFPSMLILGALAVMAFISITLSSTLQELSKQFPMPQATKLMMSVGHIAASPWIILPIALVAAFVTAVWLSLPRWSEHGRKYFDEIPPWSFYRIINGAGWLYATASIVSARVADITALRMQLRSASPWLKARLSRAIYLLSSGNNLGESLEKSGYNFPDKELVSTLAMLSKLPDIDQVMLKLAEEWLDGSVAKIKTQARILNTVAFLIAGLIVIFIALGIFGIVRGVRANTGM
jgi:type II secretory pathway component PulF